MRVRLLVFSGRVCLAAGFIWAAHAQPFLRNSQKVSTSYTGDSAMGRSFGSSRARAVALASADFDEDGMPDLASGYAAADGTGAVTIHRGNVHALWPEGAAGEQPAFLPDARVFSVPEAPDFLAAGDFDADGHWDLVAGHEGGKALYFLRGDGHGGFARAERIELPGALTAWTSGEINRADGLTDIAVAVSGPGGAQVLVFESPLGALRGKPEVIAIPAAVSALAMMPLDDDHFIDLAVGAGKELIAIHGRDRKLSYPKEVRDNVRAAEVTRQSLPFGVRQLAAGRFVSAAGNVLDLAALGDDGKVHFLQRADAEYQAARAELPVAMSNGSGAPGPMRRGTRDWSSMPKKPETRELALRDEAAMPSSLSGTVRLAVAHTSLTGMDDLIVADAAGSRLHVISRNASARAMRLAKSLDAVGAPAAVLPMRMDPSALHGLVVLGQDDVEPSVLRAETQFSFQVTTTADSGPGVGTTLSTATPGSLRTALTNATNSGGTSTITFAIPLSDPNYTSSDGTFTITPVPTSNCGGTGVDAVACQGLPPVPSGCLVDGYTQSGASVNTQANGDNAAIKIRISGASATTDKGASGLQLESTGATVRGLLVTGFSEETTTSGVTGGFGIEADGSGNIIEGNFLGTSANGTAASGNYIGTGGFGGGNTVGGTTPQARNLLSGNFYSNFGASAASASNTYFVQGNYIGTDSTGTVALGGQGFSNNGTEMVIGGTTAGAGNLVSGSSQVGIGMSYASGNVFTPDSNIVQGNLVGTDLTGTKALANQEGILVDDGNDNQIGGTTPAARNVVSGNGLGIAVDDGALQNNVQGNYVGTDITGGVALPNSGDGIYHSSSGTSPAAAGTLIGGAVAGAGNVISANLTYGIEFGVATTVQGVTGESVFGNLIGSDATGLKALGNGYDGILINDGGGYVTIGGTGANEANLIAYNTYIGIAINPAGDYSGSATTFGADPVTGNSIFSNGSFGIHILSGTGNQVSQNSIYSNGDLGIGIGASSPNTCQAATTGGGNDVQNAPVLTAAGGGTTLVTATATDPNGNTSQFSNCAAMTTNGNVATINGTLNSTPNTTYNIEFFANASCSGPVQGQTFLNRISVTTGSNCMAAIGDTATVPAADMSVALTGAGGATTVTTGQNFTYNALVTNNGASSAGSVSFSDTFPAGEAIVSASSTVGTCTTSSQTVTCAIGTMLNGATATVTVVTTVNSSGTITDTASVSSSTADPNNGNNSSTLSITSSGGSYSPCDVNHDGSTNVVDVQVEINEALGVAPPNNDLNGDGKVNVVDVQIEINAALGLGCAAH